MIRFVVALLVLPILAGGCVEHLVTLPARTVGLSPSNQAEADRRLGREVRRADARRQRSIDRHCRRNPRDCPLS